MHHYYSFIALDLANERVREAAEARRARLLAAGLPKRPSAFRRGLANGLAAISRASTAATRRLDEVVADDLRRTLAPSK